MYNVICKYQGLQLRTTFEITPCNWQHKNFLTLYQSTKFENKWFEVHSNHQNMYRTVCIFFKHITFQALGYHYTKQ